MKWVVIFMIVFFSECAVSAQSHKEIYCDMRQMYDGNASCYIQPIDVDVLLSKWDDGEDVVIPCNGYSDFNRDGIFSSHEIFGVKRIFREGQPVMILLRVNGDVGKMLIAEMSLRTVITNASGKIVVRKKERRIVRITVLDGDSTPHLIRCDSGKGNFVINFYAGNRYIGTASYLVR